MIGLDFLGFLIWSAGSIREPYYIVLECLCILFCPPMKVNHISIGSKIRTHWPALLLLSSSFTCHDD